MNSKAEQTAGVIVGILVIVALCHAFPWLVLPVGLLVAWNLAETAHRFYRWLKD